MFRNLFFGLSLAVILVAATAMSSAAGTVDLDSGSTLSSNGHGGGGWGGWGGGGGGGCDPGATPEPATMLLLGSGLLGMVAYKKRMRG